MKNYIVLVQVVLFFNLSFGVVLTGSLLNSTSSAPIENALIKFRIGSNPDGYPTAVSDSSGYFRAVLSVEQNYLLQIVVEKNEYVVKTFEVLIIEDSINIGCKMIDPLTQSIVSFCGTIIDSVSRGPLSGVQIDLLRNTGDSSPFIKFTADSAGIFRQCVTLSNDLNRKVFWRITQSGYYVNGGQITQSMDSVLQTIPLIPLGSIRIEVRGEIVDLISRAPISNALIVLQTNYHDVQKDSSYTGNDGIFVRLVQAGITSSAIPSLSYCIIADGYAVKFATLRLQSLLKIDLGELAMLKEDVGSLSIKPHQLQTHSNMKYNSFTLNGKTLPTSINKNKVKKYSANTASQLLINVEKSNSLRDIKK